MTASSAPGVSISCPAMYRIRVQGRMDIAWTDRLQGLTVTVTEGRDHSTVTELCGQLPDQAALMGVLQQLHNCSIPVISVGCVSAESP